MKDKRGRIVLTVILTAVLCTVQILFLINSKESGFCFAAAVFVTTAFIFTLSLCGRYLAAVCACVPILLAEALFSPYSGVVYLLISAVSLYGSVGVIYLLNAKVKFGCFFSTLAAVSVRYAALRFGVRLFAAYVAGGNTDAVQNLFSLTSLYAVLIAAAVAFFTVPAVNVLSRKADPDDGESDDKDSPE